MSLSDIKTPNRPATKPDALEGAEKVLHVSFELRGETLQASVSCKILDLDESLSRDRALVRLAAPEKYDDLPQMSKLRIYALAHLAHALIDPPQWLNKWVTKYDPLLFSLYEEVSAHEQAYFRADLLSSQEDPQRQPVVKVRSLDAPAP